METKIKINENNIKNFKFKDWNFYVYSQKINSMKRVKEALELNLPIIAILKKTK